MSVIDNVKQFLENTGKGAVNLANEGVYDVNRAIDPQWASQHPLNPIFKNPVESPSSEGPQFQNGQPAISQAPQPTTKPPYLQKSLPGETEWVQNYTKANPSVSTMDAVKLFYNAATSPGGIYAKGVPTPTPTPVQVDPSIKIPGALSSIPDDPGQPYNSIIENASKQYGVPAPLLKGMLAHESEQFAPQYVHGYHTDGTGRGVAAIDKNAHPEIPDNQAFDPSFAIPWAARTLSTYKGQEGNWYKALQRYNGGGNYDSPAPGYQGVPVAQRTKDYAENVIRQAEHFSGVSNNPNTSETPENLSN